MPPPYPQRDKFLSIAALPMAVGAFLPLKEQPSYRLAAKPFNSAMNGQRLPDPGLQAALGNVASIKEKLASETSPREQLRLTLQLDMAVRSLAVEAGELRRTQDKHESAHRAEMTARADYEAGLQMRAHATARAVPAELRAMLQGELLLDLDRPEAASRAFRWQSQSRKAAGTANHDTERLLCRSLFLAGRHYEQLARATRSKLAGDYVTQGDPRWGPLPENHWKRRVHDAIGVDLPVESDPLAALPFHRKTHPSRPLPAPTPLDRMKAQGPAALFDPAGFGAALAAQAAQMAPGESREFTILSGNQLRNADLRKQDESFYEIQAHIGSRTVTHTATQAQLETLDLQQWLQADFGSFMGSDSPAIGRLYAPAGEELQRPPMTVHVSTPVRATGAFLYAAMDSGDVLAVRSALEAGLRSAQSTVDSQREMLFHLGGASSIPLLHAAARSTASQRPEALAECLQAVLALPWMDEAEKLTFARGGFSGKPQWLDWALGNGCECAAAAYLSTILQSPDLSCAAKFSVFFDDTKRVGGSLRHTAMGAAEVILPMFESDATTEQVERALRGRGFSERYVRVIAAIHALPAPEDRQRANEMFASVMAGKELFAR